MAADSEKRRHQRMSCQEPITFAVLSVVGQAQKLYTGTIIDASNAGIGLLTWYPLLPGHILQWEDERGSVKLQRAHVRWSSRQGLQYRAGLEFD